MNIAFIAHNSKKELLVELCIAYEKVLAQHNLFATGPTANVISENTSLKVYRFLSGYDGGDVQISTRERYNEIELVLFFIDHNDPAATDNDVAVLLRSCDSMNVPIATNLATAEVLIHGLENGDFMWRDIIHEKKPS